ncbi:MAG: hypothetical protein LBE12_13490 [Planctomycetaceae bacterium]|nr:hypothetical protein [Planctomycetaceae bacterium]
MRHYPLSTINYQLSTIHYQLSTINYQLSIISSLRDLFRERDHKIKIPLIYYKDRKIIFKTLFKVTSKN